MASSRIDTAHRSATTHVRMISDELQSRSIGFRPRRHVHVHDHGGTGAGGEQLPGGQDAHPVRRRAVRRVQDDRRDGAGRGETASGFHPWHVLVRCR